MYTCCRSAGWNKKLRHVWNKKKWNEIFRNERRRCWCTSTMSLRFFVFCGYAKRLRLHVSKTKREDVSGHQFRWSLMKSHSLKLEVRGILRLPWLAILMNLMPGMVIPCRSKNPELLPISYTNPLVVKSRKNLPWLFPISPISPVFWHRVAWVSPAGSCNFNFPLVGTRCLR